MPHFYETFPLNLQEWALEQYVFFTASAPTYGRHVNLSPKGIPSSTFAIFDESHAAYLDLTGSGAETISHIYENGRVTIMFCSFSDKPRILRLFCTGRVVELGSPAFRDTIASMKLEEIPGTRAVVLLDIWKVQTSCGYAVPVIEEIGGTNEKPKAIEHTNGSIEHKVAENGEIIQPPCKCFNDRHMLEQWLLNKINKKALDDYKIKLNSRSLDGLPGLQQARRMRGESVWIGDACARTHNLLFHPAALILGMMIGISLAMAILLPSLSSDSAALPVIHVDRMVRSMYLIVFRLLLLAERGWVTIFGCPIK